MEDETKVIVSVVAIILISIIVCATAISLYDVWRKEMGGKATLEEAKWDRQVQIEEAKANLEAEKLNAKSEVERAKGVSEANAIIGKSLQDNEAYLRYLWIKGLHDGNSETIYIETEANLPILEAGRFNS
jgi:regulator of protease activity HflC (stomatin/prohibitin superfamily)